MTRRRTDFRVLKVRREAALARPELRQQKPAPVDPALVAAAIAAGKLTKIPEGKKGHRP